MHQCDVGLPFEQQRPLLLRLAEHHLDGDGSPFHGVRVEQLGEELVRRPGLRGQDQTDPARRCLITAA